MSEGARHGCPLDISEKIPTNSVFPLVEGEDADATATWLHNKITQWTTTNYKSFEDNPTEARRELERYLDEEYFVEWDEDIVWNKYPRGSVSKMALITKLREDGTEKLRIIVDLRRSGVNSRTFTPQRPGLPRLGDHGDTGT